MRINYVQLLPLQDVTIRSSNLTRPRSDNGEKTTSFELRFEKSVDLGVFLPLFEDALDVFGFLLFGGFFWHLGSTEDGLRVLKTISVLFDPREKITDMSLVPLPKRGGIDVDNTGLDKGLGSEKFVVGGVVALRTGLARSQVNVAR